MPQDPPNISSEGNTQQPPKMPNEQNGSFSLIYLALGIESLFISLLIIYLLMSKFNKKTFKETFSSVDKIIIYILSLIILTTSLTYGCITLSDKKAMNMPNINQTNEDSSEITLDAQAETIIDNEEQALSDTYEASSDDTSAILVKNEGSLILKDATVNKSGGDSSNTENSEFYGVNSGILVAENSSATIDNTKISTSAKGSNAIFSTGSNSKIYVKNSEIETSGESSARGLDATYGGYIEAENVKITTKGGSCGALATDRGEGTVIAKKSNLETNGTGSPIIYSTGDIQIEDTTGEANGSQMVVIGGKNSASVTNSTLTASAKGNRGDTDKAGIMIYQSMSGDAGEGTGTFNSTNSSLTIKKDSLYYKTAPMFFITNTDAVINLENTKLNYGSNTLISTKGTSEWGNSGANGGNIALNATNQELKGNIELDNISTLTMNLKASSYKGTINGEESSKSIDLTLDENSSITLTGDSYVSSLNNSDLSNSNINFNGYKLYVDGKAVN